MYYYADDNLHEKRNIPSSDQMFQPIMVALQQLGGTASVDEIDAMAIQAMGLSDRLASIPHDHTSGRTEVSYRLAWARSCLKKYGWIENISRGIWRISDAFNCPIEEIDPKAIMKSIRQGNIVKGIPISNLESAVAFEKFAHSVIVSYIHGQNKEIKYPPPSSDSGYDLYLPDGYDETNIPTYVIFKYSVANNKAYFKLVENILLNLHRGLSNECVLIIFGAVLSNKKQLESQVNSHYHHRIAIWDYADLADKSTEDPYQIELQLNPKKALVNEAITSIPTEKEQKEKKKELISKLKISYQRQDVALFLGAGVSIDAGIPLWSDLIKSLLISMIETKVDDKKLTNLEREALNELAYKNQEDSPLTQMRYIRTAFENEEYYNLVHDALYSQTIKQSTNLISSIVKLSSPRRTHCGVKGIVTYNFDDLIEQKLAVRDVDHSIIFREVDLPDHETLNIYHVHGYLPHKAVEAEESAYGEVELIFSEEDYHRVYRDSYCWSNLTQLNFFRESTCLFLGCSLTDPNLRRLLDVAARSGETPRHFAILKRKKFKAEKREQQKILRLYQNIDDNVRESYYKSLGINIIWVDKYEEIPSILNSISR